MNRVRIAVVVGIGLGRGAWGDIVSIGPFSGELHEPLNYSFTTIVAQFPIFGGAATLSSLDGVTTYIHLLAGDSLFGAVSPRTGGRILGFTQGPGIFLFAQPVLRFGSYFNNDSGTSDATVQFYDASNTLLGTRSAATPTSLNTWVWNGWESDVGIARIVVTGNGTLQGFLWFDDLEMTRVPEPAVGTVLGLCWAKLTRRRRHAACGLDR